MQLRTLARLFAITTALMMLGTLAAPVFAQEQEFYYKRQIAQSFTDKSALLISAARSPEGSDWVIFALDTVGEEGKGLGIGVLYGHGKDPNENKWATGTYIAPFGLVEYRDNGDGRFDLRGDSIVSAMPLNKDMDNHQNFYNQTGANGTSMKWYPRPGYNSINHTSSSILKSEMVTITAQTTNGVFTMVMHISNSIFINDTVALSPYEVKLDFIIDGYPYVANDTKLALLTFVAVGNANWNEGLPSDYEQEYKSYLAEDGMNFPIEGGAGFFSWAKQADVDGANATVTTSILAQFSEFKWTPKKETAIGVKYVAFSYGRGTKITHDPKLGYVFENGIPPVFAKLVNGSGGLFFLSIVLFVAVVAGARYAKGRSASPKQAQGPRGGAPPQGPQPAQRAQAQPAQYPPQQPYPQQQPYLPPQQPYPAQQPYPPRQSYPPQQPYPPQGPQTSQPGAVAPGTWAGWQGQQPQQAPPRQDYRPRQP